MVTLKLLLKYGADINVKNNNGNTPLHIPEGSKQTLFVQLLLMVILKL